MAVPPDAALPEVLEGKPPIPFESLKERARQSRSVWLAAVLVCAAAIIPFLSTLSGYFLCDDFGLIWLLSQKSPLHFLTLFTNPWTETIYGYRADEIRPLVALSYQVDGAWGAASPTAYHLSNIGFHALNALLVLAIGRLVVGLSVPASCFAGVLFAVMPVHVETVSWISGRADSIPTLFYLSSFLTYALWRRNRAGLLYLASVALFFFALFSKQSAITMLGTLVFYDALIARTGSPQIQRRLSWSFWTQLPGYFPYAALTAGYLGLRLLLFNTAIREETITGQKLIDFGGLQATYLQMLLTGVHSSRFDVIVVTVSLTVGFGFFCAAAIERWQHSGDTGPVTWARLFYFGPIWWTLSVGPLLVTNYLSSRHLYLASVGLAVVLGLVIDGVWSTRKTLWRYACGLSGGGLIVGYAMVLLWAVGQWNFVGSLSSKISHDVEREATTAPEGSLLVINVSGPGPTPRIWTWLWGFSLPYALQPPFMPAEVTERVSIISPPYAYCCQFGQWYLQVRDTTASWSGRTGDPPVIMLAWDASAGALIRRSDSEEPNLRGQVQGLAGASSAEELHKKMEEILR